MIVEFFFGLVFGVFCVVSFFAMLLLLSYVDDKIHGRIAINYRPNPHVANDLGGHD